MKRRSILGVLTMLAMAARAVEKPSGFPRLDRKHAITVSESAGQSLQPAVNRLQR